MVVLLRRSLFQFGKCFPPQPFIPTATRLHVRLQCWSVFPTAAGRIRRIQIYAAVRVIFMFIISNLFNCNQFEIDSVLITLQLKPSWYHEHYKFQQFLGPDHQFLFGMYWICIKWHCLLFAFLWVWENLWNVTTWPQNKLRLSYLPFVVIAIWVLNAFLGAVWHRFHFLQFRNCAKDRDCILLGTLWQIKNVSLDISALSHLQVQMSLWWWWLSSVVVLLLLEGSPLGTRCRSIPNDRHQTHELHSRQQESSTRGLCRHRWWCTRCVPVGRK